MADVMITVV